LQESELQDKKLHFAFYSLFYGGNKWDGDYMKSVLTKNVLTYFLSGLYSD